MVDSVNTRAGRFCDVGPNAMRHELRPRLLAHPCVEPSRYSAELADLAGPTPPPVKVLRNQTQARADTRGCTGKTE